MVEIIEAKYTYQYIDKYGNTRNKNKIINMKGNLNILEDLLNMI